MLESKLCHNYPNIISMHQSISYVSKMLQHIPVSTAKSSNDVSIDSQSINPSCMCNHTPTTLYMRNHTLMDVSPSSSSTSTPSPTRTTTSHTTVTQSIVTPSLLAITPSPTSVIPHL